MVLVPVLGLAGVCPLSQCVVWGWRCYSTQLLPNREFFSFWIFEASAHIWLKAAAEKNTTLRMAVSVEWPRAAPFSVLFLFARIHSTGDWCASEIQHIGSINCSESTCVPFTENSHSGQKYLTVLWWPFLAYHHSRGNAQLAGMGSRPELPEASSSATEHPTASRGTWWGVQDQQSPWRKLQSG